MKFIIKKIGLLMFSMALLLNVAQAGNVNIGQSIYANEIGSECGMDGVKFTDLHTPKEWLSLYRGDKLQDEIRKICPKLKVYDPKWSEHLFTFLYEYGKGSGVQPTCR